MKDGVSRGALRSVLIALLCGLFFLLSMGITLLSSGVYRETVDAADQNAAQRTALSYLVNQVRRGAVLGLGKFGGEDAILIYDEAGYVTILYCYDGALRELYTEPGAGLAPADGLALLPLTELTVALDGNGYLLSLAATTPDGNRETALVFTRHHVEDFGGQEVVP